MLWCVIVLTFGIECERTLLSTSSGANKRNIVIGDCIAHANADRRVYLPNAQIPAASGGDLPVGMHSCGSVQQHRPFSPASLTKRVVTHNTCSFTFVCLGRVRQGLEGWCPVRKSGELGCASDFRTDLVYYY
eukprot:307542-Rhodomonas_salina.2